MALLKRYGAYALISAIFLYMLYSLSFPYEPQYTGEGRPPQENSQPQHEEGGAGQNGGHNEEPQRPERPTEPQVKSYEWSKIKLQNPVESLIPLPSGEPHPLPKIQFEFQEEDATAKNIRETRREEVKKVFVRSWENYRQKAWMHDELKPVSGGYKDPFGGWAATLIDALDTLWIMGFKEEFTSAMKDVEKIDFGKTQLEEINIFETTIRHLGGLLAAYELSKEEVLLKKAKEVGEMLYHAFDTPNRMPKTRWNPHNAAKGERQVADSTVLVAEVGSLSMEFTRLAQITGDSKYYDAISRVTEVFEREQDRTRLPGMWPIVVNARKRVFTEDTAFSLGGMADSTYEYLSKEYALLGGQNDVYKKMYEKSMDAAIKHTLYRPMTPEGANMLMSGFVRAEGSTANLNPEMQHLVCFAGGMFALGGKIFDKPEHVTIGRKITDTCVWAYKSSPSGIMPEIAHLAKCESLDKCEWNEDAWKKEVAARASLSQDKDPQQNIANLRLPEGFTAIDDRRYILRPEAIESVFMMYRITGEQQWQAAAWDMFTAIEKASATEFGNAALLDVSNDNPPKMDSQEVRSRNAF
jgi:mannosyl-oligosaccharide alpha-1,2-mannosidase